MPRTTVNEALEAANRPVLLETQPQLESAEREWLRNPVLGIDTEFVRERTYRAALGLGEVRTSWIQRLPGARTKFRRYLPLMPRAVESLDVAEAQCVISSHHAVAHLGCVSKHGLSLRMEHHADVGDPKRHPGTVFANGKQDAAGPDGVGRPVRAHPSGGLTVLPRERNDLGERAKIVSFGPTRNR